MNLKEKLALLVEQAKAAYEKGDNDEGDRLKEEAEVVSKSLKSLGDFGDLDAILEAQKAQGTKAQSDVNTVGIVTGATTTATKDQDPSVVKTEKGSTDPVASAAYVTRFGNTEKAVDQILTDLHGSDHQNQFWEQKKAFGVYLRSDPQQPLPSWVHNALKDVILTPEVVKGALLTGFSSVEAMKATMVSGINTLGGLTLNLAR